MAAPTGPLTPQPDRPPPERTNLNGLWWYSLALSVMVHAAVLLGVGWFYAHRPATEPEVGFRPGRSGAPTLTVFLSTPRPRPRPRPSPPAAVPEAPAKPPAAKLAANPQPPRPRRPTPPPAEPDRPVEGDFASAVRLPEPRRPARKLPEAEAEPAEPHKSPAAPQPTHATTTPPQPATRPARPAAEAAIEHAASEPPEVARGEDDRPKADPPGEAAAAAAETAQASAPADSHDTAEAPAGAPGRPGVQSARPLSAIAPEYPPAAVRRGQQGRVVIEAHISATGRVTSAELARSCGHDLLDRSALRAVRAARFRPATRAGRAIAATVRVPVRFALRR